MEQMTMIDLNPARSALQKGTMPDLAEFYTTQEAAEKLGFTLQGVSKLARQKKISAIRFGRSWLVSKKAVAEYLKKTDGMSKNDPRRKGDT